MTEFRARIRSVKMKNGGADIAMLPTPVNHEGENLRGKMIEHARIIADNEGDMDGFIVIGFWADGARSMGFRVPQRIPRELLPAYVAEMVRTDACTEHEFHRCFEWNEA